MTRSDERTERLIANRRASAAKKQAHTLTKLEELLSREERVSFVKVQRAAGVSTWFVYNNPTIRSAIEAAIRNQSDHKPAESYKPAEGRIEAGLRAEIANARSEIRDLRNERDRLRQHLQRNLGDQVDAIGKRELAEQLQATEQENSRLKVELRTLTEELATRNQEFTQAKADIEGLQIALRQKIRPVD